MEILNRKINGTSKHSKQCNLADHKYLKYLVTARNNTDLARTRN